MARRPQIDAIEEGAQAARLSGCSPAAPASPLEVEDLLREILLRLPPQPSSLPCASAVCKRWQQLVTDPKFLHCFSVHHQKPPLLGFFHMRIYDVVFTPVLGPSDRIPPQRFDLRLRADVESGTQLMVNLLDCRHGRVLLLLTGRARREIIVCDPITGEQRGLLFPPKFKGTYVVNGAVLCAASERDHVHGSCHSSPFKVVLISYSGGVNNVPAASVYCSKIGIWGDIISVDVSYRLVFEHNPGLLVANALYWLLDTISDGILEFDLDEQSLTVINGPTITNDFCASHWIMQLEDGSVGIAILSYPRFQTWQMNVDCHGVVTWMMWETINMHDIPGLPSQIEGNKATMKYIVGCVEDTDEILLSVDDNVYMVQLKSMQCRKLCEQDHYTNYHCFKSFFQPGPAIVGGYNGAEMLHDASDDVSYSRLMF